MKLSAEYITGFIDGEGTFSVSFNYRAKLNTKIEVRPSFSVSQHKRSLEVLEGIYDFFKVGSIRFSKKDQNYKYETRSIKDIVKVVIPHFNKYPLHTSKAKDFAIFAKICSLVYANQHRNLATLQEIIDLAYQMNPGGKRKYTKKQLLRFMPR